MRTRTRSWLGRLFLLAGLAPLSSALGQGRVAGVAWDSLRTDRPLREGVVLIDALGRRSVLDRRGRFAFDSLPDGVWTLRLQAPWLDSMSLAPSLQVRVHARTRLDELVLGVPSRDAYERAVCGVALGGSAGVLRGEIRDASGVPREGVPVGAVWAETLVTESGLASELIGNVDTTDASGMYSICGAPLEATFLLRAGDAAFGTGELTVSLDGAGYKRLDLTAGDRSLTARVRGRVLRPTGEPVAGVVITIPGDSSVVARADANGRFELAAVPRRSSQLVARGIGFVPGIANLAPELGDVELPDLVLDPVAQELSEVRVTAARTVEEMEFRERQSSGQGVFLDEADLTRFPMLSANILSAVSTKVRSSGGSSPRTLLRSAFSSGTCAPRFFVDGLDFGVPRDGFEEISLYARAKRVEVYDGAYMPARYTDLNGCGVVLIWTR